MVRSLYLGVYLYFSSSVLGRDQRLEEESAGARRTLYLSSMDCGCNVLQTPVQIIIINARFCNRDAFMIIIFLQKLELSLK